MAAIAGAALAIANARADLDADMRAGSRSVSTALGPVNSWWLNVGLMGAASAIGFISAGPPGPGILWSSVLFGTIVVAAALGRARTADSATWRGAWQLQAIGVAFAGVGWAGLLLA
jgi:4-hydroxybenzoate polyprenyltransferase